VYSVCIAGFIRALAAAIVDALIAPELVVGMLMVFCIDIPAVILMVYPADIIVELQAVEVVDSLYPLRIVGILHVVDVVLQCSY